MGRVHQTVTVYRCRTRVALKSHAVIDTQLVSLMSIVLLKVGWGLREEEGAGGGAKDRKAPLDASSTSSVSSGQEKAD